MASVLRQQTTYRANSGVANTITVYVRDEAGRHDLSGVTALSVALYPYGDRRWSGHPVATVDATAGSTLGQLSFTIDADTMSRYFPPGLYRFDVIADGADIYPALMEVS